ncbi:MAG TPA: hypothetical protein VFX24_05465 [Ktedonobacterales bacterium]|nr:hypothetical protein [Ktedonobacterales bacterium]
MDKDQKFRRWLTAFLELARVIVLAAVAAAITAGINEIIHLVANSGMNSIETAMIIGGLTAAGKAWDRTVHEDPNTKAKGILPF